jgi:electron transport complex protein RnfC
LQPQELYWFAKSDNFEKANDYKLFDCIECGACSYVCPSNIPLVQYYRYAKSEIIAIDKAHEAADLARERNDFRLARIEREKLERAQKHAERAAAQKEEAAKKASENTNKDVNTNTLQPNIHAGAGDAQNNDVDAQKLAKQAAIAAAIERAKAAKAAAGVAPKNVTDADETVKKEIAEIDARRQAVGIEKPAVTTNVDAEKQAKIAAAIAKAKAAKAAADAAKLNENKD